MKPNTLRVFLLLSLVFSMFTVVAQPFTTDSAAVFYFNANVEKSLNPDYDKGRWDFFSRSGLDGIYQAFFSTLADSAGIKTLPPEYLMNLKGTPRMDYPKYNFKQARKRGNAPVYVKAEILFEAIGNSKSTTSIKLGKGLLSSDRNVQKQKLRMTATVTFLNAEGKPVKSVKTAVDSPGMVALKKDEGFNMGLLTGEKKSEEESLTKLVVLGALSVREKLQSGN